MSHTTVLQQSKIYFVLLTGMDDGRSNIEVEVK